MMKLKQAIPLLALTLAPACGGNVTNPGTLPVPPTPVRVTVESVPNEGWVHVFEGSAVAYRHNPPASGPHYPVWGQYKEYSAPLPRPYWVHNLEHGAIVLLYRPDAPAAMVKDLQITFQLLPRDPQCSNARALLTPDPLLPVQVAAVAADWVLTADGVDGQAIVDFTNAHRNRAPENICESGDRS
jgi:hypothetical protein